MNNDETGTVDEEFRVAAVIDRVNTTWDALHGTSFSCVQCHSHPYDPIRHDEYYKFMAFLNNTRDEDTGDEAPNIRQFKEGGIQKLTEFQTKISSLPTPQKTYINRFVKFLEPRFHAHYADNFTEGALLGGTQIGLRHTGSCRLPNLKTDGVKQLLILVEKNPATLVAMFHINDSIDANIATRAKMGQSSDVYAVALMADGKAFFAKKEVKVTLGGCGG